MRLPFVDNEVVSFHDGNGFVFLVAHDHSAVFEVSETHFEEVVLDFDFTRTDAWIAAKQPRWKPPAT